MESIIDCSGKSPREINLAIKAAVAEGAVSIRVLEPGARHNLGVALLHGTPVTFEGSVGYYCGGLSDGAEIHVKGSAGWGVAESSLSGRWHIEGNAGNGAGAALRGGLLFIEGNASARAGVSIKGGVLVIGGDCGYMTGFMGQKGSIIVCGDAGEALADSMYESTIFVAGRCDDLGHDAVIQEPTEEDLAFLTGTLTSLDQESRRDWKKVVAGRRLWNFDKRDDLWQAAL